MRSDAKVWPVGAPSILPLFQSDVPRNVKKFRTPLS
jgi:hypothetical protein